MCKVSWPFVVLAAVSLPVSCRAFSLAPTPISKENRSNPWALGSKGSNDDDNADQSGIPQLPAIGASSFGSRKSSLSDQQPLVDGEKKAVAFVSDKFELQYTCKVCDTRNNHRVSRLAYRNGVVITVCKGCDSQHLIADNLGWTDYDGGFQGETNTIEDFFKAKGENDAVNRVSGDAFELERLLHLPTDSGSIIDENGNLAME